MKKRTSKLLSLLLTLTMVLGMLPAMSQVAYAAGDVEINAANFPDANFLAFVQDYDTNSDGKLSEAELAAVTEMDCHGKEIADLTGIEHFTSLTLLYCSYNQLTSLDVSKNTALTELYCSGNQLTTLDVSANTALTWLNCYNNQLTSLDVSANTALTRLNCYNNQLTTLDVSANTALTELWCYNNQLTSLDVSKNTALTYLECYINQLTTLDVSKNTALTTLDCGTNQLTSLDVSKNTALMWLYCHNNELTSLDVSKNTALTELWCYGNNLTTLDVTEVPALKDAKENGTFDDSSSEYDVYSSSQGRLVVDKTVNIITDTSSMGIAIDAANFPDANFHTFVKTYDTDSNGYLSEAELAAVTKMNCVAKDIADLTGIEHFTALTVLDCYDNKLTTLDVNNNTALTELYCYNNQLTSLDVSANTALTYLDCGTNQLTALDVSANIALTYVRCTDNQLTSLDVSKNTALTMLYCSNNQLTTLDVSKNTQLTTLWCSGNQLTTLDVSANTALTYLWCYNNQLTTLDVSKNTNLKWLHCYGNNLTMLDVSAVPALKDAKENGTKDTSNSDYDNYSSSQGTLRVDKGFTNIITDAPADAATEYPVWVGGTQVTDANKDDILGDGKVSYTPGEGSGTLTITGTPAITGLHENALIYADGVDLTINAASGLTLNSTGSGVFISEGGITIGGNATITSDGYALYSGTGSVTVNGDADLTTGSYGYPVYSGGDVTITGDFTAETSSNDIIYAYNGNISIGGSVDAKTTNGDGLRASSGYISIGGNATVMAGGYALYSGNGFVTVNGDADLTTGSYGYPVYSGGDVTITGNFTAETSSNDIIYAYNGNISIGGSVDAKTTNGDGLRASSGYISIGGNATVMAGGYALYSGNGFVTVKGDADLTTGSYGYPVYSGGDVTITGDFTAETSSNDIIYAYNGNISIGGSVDAKTTNGDGLRASSGYISIGGNATVTAGGYALYSGNGFVTVNGDADLTTGSYGYPVYSWNGVTITGNLKAETSSNDIVYTYGGDINIGGSVDAETTKADGDGLRASNGKVIMTSGVWDITAGNYAFYAKNGIEIPSTHEVTLPDGGEINQVTVDDNTFYTVTEADGSTVAAHAVIEPVFTVTVTDGTADKAEAFKGDTVTITANDKSGYTFKKWQIVSGEITLADASAKTTTFVMTASDVDVKATYTKNSSGGGGYTYYTIKATAGVSGSISPAGSVSVRSGKDQTFTITPDKGYAISDVKIDGKSVGAVKSYTFENVKGNHTIKAIFMKANGNPQTGVFVDVPEGSYYEEAVAWAVENGITKGTSDTTFDPNGICTRAQAVTFLWRAAGSPAPKTSTMPFTDVKAGSYYYDAVLWAVENGITKGTSETTFSPDADCTRAQIVTFLWRAQKSPAADSVNPFTDVAADAYYVDAVLWAVEEKVTNGTSATTFSPDADCTRAQIVTFLYRALNEQ